ncbi:MAG: peptide ABC transporter substrate-binding protein [Verrucomicrobia bacterium]|nr:peptide ABC transporter substrate-binding protein [Verrucomicrobiota bacterium]
MLRINVSREPPSLDPRKVFDPSHSAIISMLFEGLTRLEADLSVSLAQAEAIEISKDRLKYTFRIGPYLWSDGTAVTADDFAKTWLDLLDPRFPAPNAHLLYDIKNALKAKQDKVPLSEVGIRALDEKTLEIELSHPSPSFLQVTASQALFPVCQTHDAKDAEWPTKSGSGFVCNGPFISSSWKRGMELMVRRSPTYQGRHPPRLDAIQISMIDNETSALHMYANGNLDIIGTSLSQIPLPYLKDLWQQKSLKVYPVAASLFCAFNTNAFPFNNPNLRRAFATAIDRKEIVKHVTQLEEELGLAAIPSVLKGKKTAYVSDGNGKLAREYFKQAMAELKIDPKEFEKITLYYWPLEVNYHLAQTLQQQWLKNLGIKIQIEVIDFKSLMAKVNDGTYQMAIFAWTAEYGDPIALLERFRNKTDTKNYCRWHNESFNELLDLSAAEADSEKRALIIEKAEALLMGEMPIAPIFHWNFSYLIQPEVKGVTIDPLGRIAFDKISIQAESKSSN